MLLYLLLGLLEGLQRESCTKNWVLKIPVQEDGNFCLFCKIVIKKTFNHYVSEVNPFYEFLEEPKTLQTRTFRTKSRNNLTLKIWKSVKNSLRKFIRTIPVACLMFLIVLEPSFLLDYVYADSSWRTWIQTQFSGHYKSNLLLQCINKQI